MALCSDGPIWLWPIYLWPYMAMASCSYGRHLIGHVFRTVSRNVFGHVLRHVLGHGLRHVLGHVLGNVFGHEFRHASVSPPAPGDA